jgi:hypothetical protein
VAAAGAIGLGRHQEREQDVVVTRQVADLAPEHAAEIAGAPKPRLEAGFAGRIPGVIE